MSLHEDLLEQAELLIETDARRPKQANLRRAVSAAYYALFHLLIDEASKRVVAESDQPALRRLIARAFTHRDMKEACKRFANGTSDKQVRLETVCGTPVSQALRNIAREFVALQEARHEADYDLTVRLTRNEVKALVERVSNVFVIWESEKQQDSTKLFLMSLLFGDRWKV